MEWENIEKYTFCEAKLENLVKALSMNDPSSLLGLASISRDINLCTIISNLDERPILARFSFPSASEGVSFPKTQTLDSTRQAFFTTARQNLIPAVTGRKRKSARSMGLNCMLKQQKSPRVK